MKANLVETRSYETETKIRLLIQELMVPFTRKIDTFEERIQEFSKIFNSQAKKTEEIDIFLRKLSKTQTFAERLSHQIAELEGNRVMTEARREQDLLAFMEKFDKLQNLIVTQRTEFQINRVKMEGIVKEQTGVKDELIAYKQKTWEEMANLAKKQQELNKEHKKELNNLRESIEKVDARIEYNKSYEKEQCAKMSVLEHLVKRLEEKITSKIKKKDEAIKQTIVLLRSDINEAKLASHKAQNIINETDQYISKVLPVKIHSQIFQAFHSCFPKKLLAKLQNCDTENLRLFKKEVESNLSPLNKKNCELPSLVLPEISVSESEVVLSEQPENKVKSEIVSSLTNEQKQESVASSVAKSPVVESAVPEEPPGIFPSEEPLRVGASGESINTRLSIMRRKKTVTLGPDMAEINKEIEQKCTAVSESIRSEIEKQILELKENIERLIASKEREKDENIKGQNERLAKLDDFVERELIKSNRQKSDTRLTFAAIDKKLGSLDSRLQCMNGAIEKAAKIISCLVEEFYIQHLIDMSNEENDKGTVIKYRDELYTKAELVKLRSDLLNNTWNPLSLHYPWGGSNASLMQKHRLELATSQMPDLKSYSKVNFVSPMQKKSGRNVIRDLTVTPSGARKTFFVEHRGASRTHSRQINKSFV